MKLKQYYTHRSHLTVFILTLIVIIIIIIAIKISMTYLPDKTFANAFPSHSLMSKLRCIIIINVYSGNITVVVVSSKYLLCAQ